ncbi:MAG: hypothetical protein Q7N50_05755 [Armatimonadota bacterium]|nr:hypothetical protein [Armatimonadota bacterium]
MRKDIIMHPYLFAAYPVLFLFSKNMDEASLALLVRPLCGMLAVAFLTFAILRLILKDSTKASIFVTLMMTMLFAYQPVYGALGDVTIMGFEIGRHRFLAPAWTAMAVIIPAIIVLFRWDLQQFSKFLTMAGTILIVTSTFQTAFGFVRLSENNNWKRQWAKLISERRQETKSFRWSKNTPKPDIYYIILDAYVRADILKQEYKFDNSEFLDYLRGKGFFVAEKSRSNYPVTCYSIPSSTNFDYLHKFAKSAKTKTIKTIMLREMADNSMICRTLKDQGYSFAYLTSGFQVTSGSRYANIVFPEQEGTLSELERVLVDSTPFRFLRPSDRSIRKHHLFLFSQLRRIPGIEKPTFTFAHIVCPHPPFVFSRNGKLPSLVASFSEGTNYVEQVIYLNKLVEDTIDHILSSSKTPPIIIIQADHGVYPLSWSKYSHQPSYVRTAILNAYYFPGGKDKVLYDSISPVNSFRVLLNQYFGADYEILKDEVYYPTKGEKDWSDYQVGDVGLVEGLDSLRNARR